MQIRIVFSHAMGYISINANDLRKFYIRKDEQIIVSVSNSKLLNVYWLY